MTTKRVFFAFDAHAPWKKQEPKGRLIRHSDRHVTVAFLGNIDYEALEPLLAEIPIPDMRIGPIGIIDYPLFLPNSDHPHVFAAHVDWLTPGIDEYRNRLTGWLIEHGYAIAHADTPWLPHTTYCRKPFDSEEWQKQFAPMPLYSTALHLYESLPQLCYEPIWSHHFLPPISKERIIGETEAMLNAHVKAAEAFDPKMQIAGQPYLEDGLWVKDVQSSN
ncbi:MAG: hypothetical protein H7A37_10730 [Chlamydiales bacterium]|nr:hypothetical protein [Chlamydiia bacterium]MCP5508753.1 hypothetical protein [Chlamydiales bacterium]